MKQRIDRLLGIILIVLMIIMTIDVLWGVVTRYALGSQAGWTEELARFLLIWIGILGAAYTSGQKLHLAIDLFQPDPKSSSGHLRHWAIHLSVLSFAFFVLLIGGFRLIYISHILGQTSPALGLPMTLVYMVIPLSGLLILYYKLIDLTVSKKLTTNQS